MYTVLTGRYHRLRHGGAPVGVVSCWPSTVRYCSSTAPSPAGKDRYGRRPSSAQRATSSGDTASCCRQQASSSSKSVCCGRSSCDPCGHVGEEAGLFHRQEGVCSCRLDAGTSSTSICSFHPPAYDPHQKVHTHRCQLPQQPRRPTLMCHLGRYRLAAGEPWARATTPFLWLPLAPKGQPLRVVASVSILAGSAAACLSQRLQLPADWGSSGAGSGSGVATAAGPNADPTQQQAGRRQSQCKLMASGASRLLHPHQSQRPGRLW